MENLKKLSWMSLVGIFPIYILLNMTGYIRIFIDDEKYQILKKIYLTQPVLFLWLLSSSIIVFLMSLFFHWLPSKLRTLLQVYVGILMLTCMYQILNLNNFGVFLSILGSYTAVSASIRINTITEQKTI